MPQDNWQVDGIQIEPGSGSTLTITRDSGDDSLKFIDAVITSGVTLKQLAGLRNVTGVLVVGRAGDGAPYTTITSALAAVSVSSSETAPTLILVLPGVYSENITIDVDGVAIVGLGLVVLQPSTTTDPTVTIEAGTGTPKWVLLKDLKVEHSTDGEDCIYINGGASSEVGSSGIHIVGCSLVTTGVGGYQIRASTVNNIYVRGGTWAGSASTSICSIAQCAKFEVSGLVEAQDFQFSYDTGNSQPSVTTSEYRLYQVGKVTDITGTFTGAGSLLLTACGDVGDVTVGGDQTFDAVGCRLGALTLDDTCAGTLIQSARGAISGAGTLQESMLTGSMSFSGSTSEAETFDVDQPDATYTVNLDWEDTSVVACVTSRATTGFTVETSGSYTGTVYWSIPRNLS